MDVLTLEAAQANGLLATLCRKVESIVWSDVGMMETRIQHGMENRGYEYVWQMAREKEEWIKKIKNYGRGSHVYVALRVFELGLTFGMLFAPDLCDEIERVTGKRPEATPVPTASTARPAAAAPAPEPSMTLAERVLKMRDDASAHRNRLRREIALLNGLSVVIDSGLAVAVNEQTPEESRRFIAECAGTPTIDQIHTRVRLLESTIATLDLAFKGSARGTAFENWLAVAKILDGP